MTRRPPPRNLPPNAEPWGRDVDRRIMDLETAQSTSAQATQNTLSSLNSSLLLLGTQLNTIATTADTLSNLFSVQTLTTSVSSAGDLSTLTLPGYGTAFLASGTVLSGTSSSYCQVDLEVRPGGALPVFLFATLEFNLMGGGAGSYVQISNLTPQPLAYSNGSIVPRVTSVTGTIEISLRVISANI